MPRCARRGVSIGYCETPFWNKAQPETRSALERTARALRATGVAVARIELPPQAAALNDGFGATVAAEAVQTLAWDYRKHRRLLSDRARKLVETGLALDPDDLQRARGAQIQCALAVDRLFDRFDALLTPAAPGEPDRGRELGNNEFNRIWTAMHLPCVALPAGRGPRGLPVGIQLVGRRGADRALLALAAKLAPIAT